MASCPTPEAGDTRRVEEQRLERFYAKAFKAAEDHEWEPARCKIALEILDRLHRVRGLAFAPANGSSFFQQQINVGANDAAHRTVVDIMTDPGFVEWLEKEKNVLDVPVDAPRAREEFS